jgi:hypothetical protein
MYDLIQGTQQDFLMTRGYLEHRPSTENLRKPATSPMTINLAALREGQSIPATGQNLAE